MLLTVKNLSEVEENQEAIKYLCQFAGLGRKYTDKLLAAYTALTACNHEQSELFYNAFHLMDRDED